MGQGKARARSGSATSMAVQTGGSQPKAAPVEHGAKPGKPYGLLGWELFRQPGARNDDEDHRPPGSRQSGRHRAIVQRAVPDNLSAMLTEFVFRDSNRHKLADGASNCLR